MLIATLALVRAKAQASNLIDFLEILKDAVADPHTNLTSLTQDYGQLLIKQVRRYCERYINKQYRSA